MWCNVKNATPCFIIFAFCKKQKRFHWFAMASSGQPLNGNPGPDQHRFSPTADATTLTVASLTADQLRDELRARGLDTSGLKTALRERLDASLVVDPALRTVTSAAVRRGFRGS